MRKRVLGILLCILFIGCMIPIHALAADKLLDEIENYEITIHVRQDGTLDMKYEIDWKVLSDKNGKEPLEWVIVGIPNKHVDQIQGLTDNIASIAYSNKGNGDYIRVDFTEKYHEGDLVHFAFAIHQSYMYMLDEEDVCRYSFTPGWFEKIEIKQLHILWKNEYVVSSDAVHKNEKYLEWYKTDMEVGEHYEVNVRYHLSTFDVDEKMQYKKTNNDDIHLLIAVMTVLLLCVFIVFILINIASDDYGGGSGFGGGVYYHSSCAHSSCACAHSCACACACAGGGRAGCSAKDFYNTKNLAEACRPWYRRIFH